MRHHLTGYSVVQTHDAGRLPPLLRLPPCVNGRRLPHAPDRQLLLLGRPAQLAVDRSDLGLGERPVEDNQLVHNAVGMIGAAGRPDAERLLRLG